MKTQIMYIGLKIDVLGGPARFERVTFSKLANGSITESGASKFLVAKDMTLIIPILKRRSAIGFLAAKEVVEIDFIQG